MGFITSASPIASVSRSRKSASRFKPKLAALGKICLSRRFLDKETVQQEVAAYEREKNVAGVPI